jgi:hypothetical protein
MQLEILPLPLLGARSAVMSLGHCPASISCRRSQLQIDSTWTPTWEATSSNPPSLRSRTNRRSKAIPTDRSCRSGGYFLLEAMDPIFSHKVRPSRGHGAVQAADIHDDTFASKCGFRKDCDLAAARPGALFSQTLIGNLQLSMGNKVPCRIRRCPNLAGEIVAPHQELEAFVDGLAAFSHTTRGHPCSD